MTVFSEDKGQIRHVNVISYEGKDLEHLTHLLEQGNVITHEIIIYDTEVLPVKAVDKLACSMRNRKIRLFVQKKILRDYLLRLGIPAMLLKPDKNNSKDGSVRAIVFGGSTDSLDKIIKIADKMYPSQIPVFVIQHIRQDVNNLLPELLERRTKYVVISPEDGMKVESGRIYTAPSGCHMIVRNGRIRLLNNEPVSYAKPSVDVLFESLAVEYKEELLTILLCGYGHYGAAGLGSVKSAGGKVIVEEPEERKAQDTPLNVLKNERYPVMKLEKIIEYINSRIADTIDWEAVIPDLESIYERYGYDFRNYHQISILRRISSYIFKEKEMTLQEWMQNIKENRESASELLSGLTVRTTEFFRDGKVYAAIRETILPYLDSYPSIKIWCAGCSTGEEAYSIAILLDEAGMLDKSLVYATDLSFNSIRQAQNGLYCQEEIEKGMKNFHEFEGKGSLGNCFSLQNTYYEIKDRYKEHVLFFQHSLVGSGVINEFQLILCRNVLMYFNQELQSSTLGLFYESMDRSGFLVLGKSEGVHALLRHAGFNEIDSKNKIYKRRL